MSVRHYCDICGAEIDRNYVSQRVEETVQLSSAYCVEPVKVEIRLVVGKTWNYGDLCLGCTRKAVDKAIEATLPATQRLHEI